jgi:superkiller protein 3
LRLNPNDCLSWTCLGEAYARTGRWEASLKSLARAREIEPDNWLPIFILGEVQIQVGLFERAVDSYTFVLSGRDDEAKIGARQSLADAFFAMGKGQQSQGFLARAEYSLLESLDLSKKNLESKSGHRRLAWKSAADSLFALGQLGVFQDKQRIRSSLKAINSYSRSSSLDSDLLEALGPSVDDELGPLAEICAKLAIVAFNLHFTLSETEASESQSMAAFDLATSIFYLGNVLNSPDEQTSCRTQAIRFAKRAVRLDPSFEQAWILLGDLHRINAPKIAQHAYIQALEINRNVRSHKYATSHSLTYEQSVKAWCRLGFLYLKEESTELAKQAFLEAQVCEPAYSPAWIGHGIIAQKQHRNGEADSIWSYAAHLEGSQVLTHGISHG